MVTQCCQRFEGGYEAVVVFKLRLKKTLCKGSYRESAEVVVMMMMEMDGR
jgi:hypothetical protein